MNPIKNFRPPRPSRKVPLKGVKLLFCVQSQEALHVPLPSRHPDFIKKQEGCQKQQEPPKVDDFECFTQTDGNWSAGLQPDAAIHTVEPILHPVQVSAFKAISAPLQNSVTESLSNSDLQPLLNSDASPDSDSDPPLNFDSRPDSGPCSDSDSEQCQPEPIAQSTAQPSSTSNSDANLSSDSEPLLGTPPGFFPFIDDKSSTQENLEALKFWCASETNSSTPSSVCTSLDPSWEGEERIVYVCPIEATPMDISPPRDNDGEGSELLDTPPRLMGGETPLLEGPMPPPLVEGPAATPLIEPPPENALVAFQQKTLQVQTSERNLQELLAQLGGAGVPRLFTPPRAQPRNSAFSRCNAACHAPCKCKIGSNGTAHEPFRTEIAARNGEPRAQKYSG